MNEGPAGALGVPGRAGARASGAPALAAEQPAQRPGGGGGLVAALALLAAALALVRRRGRRQVREPGGGRLATARALVSLSSLLASTVAPSPRSRAVQAAQGGTLAASGPVAAEPAPAVPERPGPDEPAVLHERQAADRGNGRASGVPAEPAGVPHYVSADTAPAAFAVRRSPWLAPLALAVFASLCAAVAPALPQLTEAYGRILAELSRVPHWQIAQQDGSLSVRPFFLLLMLVLSLCCVGSARQRLRLLIYTWTLYVVAVVELDVLLVAARSLGAPSPFSQAAGLAAGIIGVMVIVLAIFRQFHLPPGVRVANHRRRARRYGVFVVGSGVLVTILVVTLLHLWNTYEPLRFRYFGGAGSGFVLFLLLMVTTLFVLSRFDRAARPASGPELSIGFLIPAYNEADGIAECIRALDAAAANYPGRCRLYAVDNDSPDGTRDVAERALAECGALTGTVLQCDRKGKAHALNFGLQHIEEDVVVRVDADTIVLPSVLQKVVPYFWDPSVGGVSGLPLPKRSAPFWLYPLRLIEVCYGVSFLRVAQGAADAIMVLPGILAAYRRELVERLGGFGVGFNGEDADITVRIGRAGYRVITDPDIHVFTEVPQSIAHLREQRQRWARGLFHMGSRNLSIIWMRQGARGLWLLPWSVLNGARRMVMIPILICLVVVETMDPSVLSLREVSVVGGFIVGLQLVVIVVVLVAHRSWRTIPWVPAYVPFRLLRAYFAFETLLTLRLKDDRAALSPSPADGLGPARAMPDAGGVPG